MEIYNLKHLANF